MIDKHGNKWCIRFIIITSFLYNIQYWTNAQQARLNKQYVTHWPSCDGWNGNMLIWSIYYFFAPLYCIYCVGEVIGVHPHLLLIFVRNQQMLYWCLLWYFVGLVLLDAGNTNWLGPSKCQSRKSREKCGKGSIHLAAFTNSCEKNLINNQNRLT